MFRTHRDAVRRLPGPAGAVGARQRQATIPGHSSSSPADASRTGADPRRAAGRAPIRGTGVRLATMLLAIPLALGAASAASAGGYCEKADRIGHRESECLRASWDNTDFIGKNYFHTRNECADYGRVVAKIDLKGASDKTWQLNDAEWRHGESLSRVREISCCSDKSTLCNRSDVVNEAGCLARFREASPAAGSCTDVTATPVISGEDYSCTIAARCPRASIYGQGPTHYRDTSVTVAYLDLDKVENCGGTLRTGGCGSGRSAGEGPSLRVADAAARERSGATLDFAVTLDGPAAAAVTVDYATADGTASAGRDYRAKAGRLTFAPGETARTVAVAVLEDAHDEGAETMTLTLSGASGARMGDGKAVGTIRNEDPVPRAWLARFGRTVSGHVVDAVEARLEAQRESGLRAALAGRELTWQGRNVAPGPGPPRRSGLRDAPRSRQARGRRGRC